MDFLHTHPNAKLRFFAGNMQLAVDSDAAYLVLPGAKSRYAGNFYLESYTHPLSYNKSPNNAPILTECKTLKNVVCFAAEAECGGIFNNVRAALVLKRIFEGIGHPQRPIGIKTDNNTANAFAYENMRSKRSKAWDMQYHWLKQ